MLIEKFRDRPDFRQFSLARFDYLGFGPFFKNHEDWRQALSVSLNYDQLKELYHALGRPGCPSLPSSYFEKPVCIPFEPQRAQDLIRNQALPSLQKSIIGFSKMGGDDIQRGMEWVQGQWSQALKWNFQLDGREQGSYLQQLRADPPPVFRKGVTLDRPTCLAALEIFAPDHRENYLRFEHPEFSKILTQLKQTSDQVLRRRLCQSGIELLMKNYALIPLGEIHFSMLANPQFKGWEINELNQLDLTRLETSPHPKPHQGPNSSSPSDAPIRNHRPSKE
jgi:oligopeptide transport system substrate-binding protein